MKVIDDSNQYNHMYVANYYFVLILISVSDNGHFFAMSLTSILIALFLKNTES